MIESFDFVESSYSGGTGTYGEKIRRMESIKVSHLSRVGAHRSLSYSVRHNLVSQIKKFRSTKNGIKQKKKIKL